jgi:hypothetical protein
LDNSILGEKHEDNENSLNELLPIVSMSLDEFTFVVESLYSVMRSVYEYNVNKLGAGQFAKNRESADNEKFKSAHETAIELRSSSEDQQM